MRRSAEDRLIQGVLDVVVGGAGAAAAVRATVGYQSGFIYIELVRRGYVRVGVDDHICFGLMRDLRSFAQEGLYRLREGKSKVCVVAGFPRRKKGGRFCNFSIRSSGTSHFQTLQTQYPKNWELTKMNLPRGVAQPT